MSVQYTGPDTTITTTGNIDDLDFGNATLLRVNNAADATIRGLKAGVDGQIVVVASIGAGNVFLAHQNAGSAAANRLINDVTSGNTPLAAGKGAAIYQYDGTTARWRLVNHEQGAFLDVAYASGNFTSSTGTWTVDAGDQLVYRYRVDGNKLEIVFMIDTSTVSGGQAQLKIAFPNGYLTPNIANYQTFSGGLMYNDNSTGWVDSGTMFTSPNSGILFMQGLLGTTTWAASTNATYVRASFWMEIA